jgi:prophage tail gpP-like protein
MTAESVTISAGGQQWSAFTRVMIEASSKEAARSFRLDIAAELGADGTAWSFKAGTAVEIKAGGDLLVKGYVDKYEPRMSATEAEVAVSGRSKSQDAIDSSAVHKTGRFEKKTPLEVAKELDKFGIGFSSDTELKPVDRVQITPGETVFQIVERLAREQGATLQGEADGSIKITKAGEKPQRHAGGLVEGVHIKVGEASHDWSGRHSDVKVLGQRPAGHGADNLEIEAAVRDSAVGRYRPLVVVLDHDTTKDRAKTRAKGRRDRSAGNSLKATITVVGWRDEAGQIWTPGRTVWVESPFLQVMQDMLIESVTYSQAFEEGTLAKLSLVDPRAHGGKAGKGAKSSAAWAQDSSDAE